MAHRLSLLQKMAYRWYLGKDQPSYPGTLEGATAGKPSAQCRHTRQSVGQDYWSTTGVGGEERGYDRGKKVKGRKRHLLVDTEGFVLKAKVHSAKVMDYEGIKALLEQAGEQFWGVRHLWVDAGYRGENKGKDWVEKKLGWSVELVERVRANLPPKKC